MSAEIQGPPTNGTVTTVAPSKSSSEAPGRPIAIGIDFGGSGIKGAAVDTASGRLVSERIRIKTPDPSTPAACLDVMVRIVRRVEAALEVAAPLPVGVGIPSVMIDGVSKTAANIDRGWQDYPIAQALADALGRPVVAINDADAAGIAEMRFGAGVGRRGTVIVLTLGTGTGSAIFYDGRLLPNTELGHMEIRGRDAEKRSAAAARVRRGLSWKAWAADLDEHLQHIERLFSPRLFIIGGGVSKNADKFLPRLTVRAEVVPAALRNEAGIIGAAIAAVEGAAEAARPSVTEAAASEPLVVAPEASGVGDGSEPSPRRRRRRPAAASSDS
ncbi:MAG TPA: ROK family protein [Candidatus Limnocylindrales bacterium]|nr:ROK family protein [Candidatus Limnocylindrales bacterium]